MSKLKREKIGVGESWKVRCEPGMRKRTHYTTICLSGMVGESSYRAFQKLDFVASRSTEDVETPYEEARIMD